MSEQLSTADLNWFRVLEHHASRTPDKPLCVFEGVAVSYADMAGRAAALGCRPARPGRRTW